MRKISALLLSVLLLTGCAAPGRKMESALKGGDILQIDQKSAPAGITMEFEWPEYDASVTGVTYLLKNNTDEAYSTGTYDELEVQSVNGEWSAVPTVENAGWTAVELFIEPGTARAFTVVFSFYDYDFQPGVYRVLKDGYSAEFTLTDGAAISAETPYGFAPLEELPEDFSTENCIVCEDGRLSSGTEPIKAFLEKVSLDMNCQLRSVERASNGSAAVIDIICEDGRFLRRSLTDGDIAEKFFSYIITDGTDLYLSNAADWATAANHARYTTIETPGYSILPAGCADAQLVSLVEDMTAARLDANITRYKVWSPDGTMDACLTTEPTKLSMGDKGYGTTVDLQDYDGLETAILDIAWQEDGSVLLTCNTINGELSTLRAVLERGPLGITITSP